MEREELGVLPRVAGQPDLPALTDTLWAAFRADPLWGWAFPEHEKLAAWWCFLIRSALRYQHVFVAGEFAAVSVWIPPGAAELTEEEEGQVGPLLDELLGPHAPAVLRLLERFESAQPRDPPHYYLSLLGTHPKHRGAGLGMGLLAENLARIDREGMPSYLESSNPENVGRYERLGFERIGEFSTPDERHSVATMWRESSPSG